MPRYDAGASGSLVGEYDGAGNLIQETVWLGDIPVATVRPHGSSIAVYYVVTDQLDTPREVIRPSDNALMWTWFSGPFGSEAPNTNPQGAGAFTYDLRFPGQIAGSWGSTYQNYFRDYDPTVGRFVEPDPAGIRLIPRDPALQLGLTMAHYSLHEADNRLNALYAYAGLDPIDNLDPMGLDDYSKECVGRYASCSITQNPNDSWILNLLRFEVCKRSINQVCKRTAPQYCCELDRTSCFANAAGSQRKTAQCTIEYAKCVSEGDDK